MKTTKKDREDMEHGKREVAKGFVADVKMARDIAKNLFPSITQFDEIVLIDLAGCIPGFDAEQDYLDEALFNLTLARDTAAECFGVATPETTLYIWEQLFGEE